MGKGILRIDPDFPEEVDVRVSSFPVTYVVPGVGFFWFPYRRMGRVRFPLPYFLWHMGFLFLLVAVGLVYSSEMFGMLGEDPGGPVEGGSLPPKNTYLFLWVQLVLGSALRLFGGPPWSAGWKTLSRVLDCQKFHSVELSLPPWGCFPLLLIFWLNT